MRWWTFLACVVGFYLLANACFALLYLLAGPDALRGSAGSGLEGGFWRAFLFSVETFSTVGYGQIEPMGAAAGAIMTAESLTGWLCFALATGLLFARFSRPTARIAFSQQALVAPYQEGSALEFRIANKRRHQLVNLQAEVVLSRMEGEGAQRKRTFHRLSLERSSVAFFPLSWTVVHPISENSPLRGSTPDHLAAAEAEVLILLSGFDETFGQAVHARSSYRAEEIVWNARFESVFVRRRAGAPVSIDLRKLGDSSVVENSGAGLVLPSPDR